MTLACISHWYEKKTRGWEEPGKPDDASNGPVETDGLDKIAAASSSIKILREKLRIDIGSWEQTFIWNYQDQYQ